MLYNLIELINYEFNKLHFCGNYQNECQKKNQNEDKINPQDLNKIANLIYNENSNSFIGLINSSNNSKQGVANKIANLFNHNAILFGSLSNIIRFRCQEYSGLDSILQYFIWFVDKDVRKINIDPPKNLNITKLGENIYQVFFFANVTRLVTDEKSDLNVIKATIRFSFVVNIAEKNINNDSTGTIYSLHGSATPNPENELFVKGDYTPFPYKIYQ
jgi:hypothetical protein